MHVARGYILAKRSKEIVIASVPLFEIFSLETSQILSLEI